jgi:K+ transporter
MHLWNALNLNLIIIMIKIWKVLYTKDRIQERKLWKVVDFKDNKYIILNTQNPEWYRVFELDFNRVVERFNEWIYYYK